MGTGLAGVHWQRIVTRDGGYARNWDCDPPPDHPFGDMGTDVVKPFPNSWGHEGPQPVNSKGGDDEGSDVRSDDGRWHPANHGSDYYTSDEESSNNEDSSNGGERVTNRGDNLEGQNKESGDKESEASSQISFDSTEMVDTGPPERLIPTVDKPEASLPAAQFPHQVAVERD